MALPNFRLPQTQARWSLYIALIAAIGLFPLGFLTFKGFQMETKSIWYSPVSKFGKMRPPMVFAGTAAVMLCGMAAAGMGYSSLGEKRNDKQSMSWMGLLGGALSTSCAVICLIAWQMLNMSIISTGAGGS